MNVLITGVAGFIGSHVAERLLKAKHTVVGLDNMNQFYDPEIKQANLIEIEKTAEALQTSFIFYAEDIRHGHQVAQILKEHQIDVIIHLAAMAGVQPSFTNPLLYTDININGTTTLLEEAKNAGVKNFIFGSSSSVYGNAKLIPFCEANSQDEWPLSPYAASKKAAELLCYTYYQTYQMRIACLRFFTVYGPRQRPDLAIHKFLTLIGQGQKVPVYGDDTSARDYTFITDITHGIELTLDWLAQKQNACYEIFNLGGNKSLSINELLGHIEKVIGKAASRQQLPARQGDVTVTSADLTKSKTVLGYEPQTPIEEGLKIFWQALQQNAQLIKGE